MSGPAESSHIVSARASHRNGLAFFFFVIIVSRSVDLAYAGIRLRSNSRGGLTSFVLFPLASRALGRTTHLSDARRARARERGRERASKEEQLTSASYSERFDCCGERRINFHSRRRCTAKFRPFPQPLIAFINKCYS